MKFKVTDVIQTLNERLALLVATNARLPVVHEDDIGKAANIIYGRVAEAPTIRATPGGSAILLEDLDTGDIVNGRLRITNCANFKADGDTIVIGDELLHYDAAICIEDTGNVGGGGDGSSIPTSPNYIRIQTRRATFGNQMHNGVFSLSSHTDVVTSNVVINDVVLATNYASSIPPTLASQTGYWDAIHWQEDFDPPNGSWATTIDYVVVFIVGDATQPWDTVTFDFALTSGQVFVGTNPDGLPSIFAGIPLVVGANVTIPLVPISLYRTAYVYGAGGTTTGHVVHSIPVNTIVTMNETSSLGGFSNGIQFVGVIGGAFTSFVLSHS